ncbi:glycosyltransferase [Bacillus sp. V3B]|uniref:glycosyltransferase n=1 Tax=Bacillus sp. V3B TaxID=2804915 RepID=UPI00210D3B44|nr:glycosyltransferase [Bacillus sp. V3B]MCQ6276839.1 glycosyltransferase [Bacillus sp. V3B]
MKVLHLNAGNETGGGMVHILSLLKNNKNMILGLFEEGPMLQQAVSKGIEVQLFHQKSKFDFTIIKKVCDFIDKNGIDIFHTHGPRANLYGYFIKRKRPDCKWVTTVHSNPYHDFLKKGISGSVLTKLHLWALKKPDHYFAISTRFQELLSREGIMKDQITTIFNGIDFSTECSFQITRADLALNKDDFVVMMIARLTPVKGHTVALQALEKIVAEHRQVKLLLVGDGFLEEEMKQLTKNLRLEKHVSFLGFRNDVPSLLKIVDLNLLTSYSESFPLVLLEAAREKKAVITTDVGGVRDLIPSEDYGWIVPVKDIESLVEALEEAIKLKEKGELAQKGIRLYNRASKKFTLESFQKSVFDTYKALLKEPFKDSLKESSS